MKKIILGTIGVLALIWAVLFLGVLPSQLVQAQSSPFTAGPADVGLDYDEVSIPVTPEGLSLSAWWMPAENAQSVVLYVHGANGNKEEFHTGGLIYYAELVKRGHHVMAIDLRNHGASDRSEDGRLTFGAQEHRDVLAALDMIAQLAPGIPVIGSGVSMGGATLIEATARDDRMKALILIDPLLDPQSAMLGGMHAILGLPKPLLGPTLWSATNLFGLGGDGPRPLETGKALSLPILLIQDPGDPVTQMSYSQELADGNTNITYHVLPSPPADHPVLTNAGGWGSHGKAVLLEQQEVMDQIDQFLASL
ncbi:MAG: alpha/beta fold hydrolase [Rhodobiaceae bacterium]|nr:alpha/beta fold hydrolase [Rhodobiaceae bacterium]